MKRFVFSALFAVGLCAPAFSDTVAPGHNLAFVQNVASFSVDVVRQWAANSDPYAAMAAPQVPNALFLSIKDERRSVATGVSQGAKTVEQADSEALAMCEAYRSKDLLPCVIVARVSPN